MINIFGRFKDQKEMSKDDQDRKRLLDALVQRAKENPEVSAAMLGQALADAQHMIDNSAGVQHVAAVNLPHVTPPGNMGVLGSLSNQLQGGQVLAGQGWVNPPRTTRGGSNNKAERLFGMLAMRMRWDATLFSSQGFDIPFHGITLLERADGVVLILIATATDHVLLEDDGAMFPSDNLITKLRVLTP